MTYTPTLAITTELQAVNALLQAGGEAPVTSVVGQRPDVATAQELVREATRELLSRGWRFNTEIGFEVLPSATLDWEDTSETTTELNIFTPPANLLSFSVTAAPHQQGGDYLDTVIRPARSYGSGTLVFYDRALNRDGFARPAIWINPVWLFDFDKLPQCARDVIVARAAVRYLGDVVGDLSSAPVWQGKEARAMDVLEREFGDIDDYNVFNNWGVTGHRGGRGTISSGVSDPRWSPGPA